MCIRDRFTRSDLAEPHDLSKIKERKLVLYALKTPASADLFHIWIYEKLGIKGAKPIPGLSSSGGYQAFLRGEIHLSSHGAANYVKKVKPEIEAVSPPTAGLALSITTMFSKPEKRFALVAVAPSPVLSSFRV